jgi:hypothetical protein
MKTNIFESETIRSVAAKTAPIGVAAVALLVVLVAYSSIVAPALAQTATPSSTSTSETTIQTGVLNNCLGPWAGPSGRMHQGELFGQPQSAVSLSVGQTITVASTSGEYATVSTSSTNGTASGTMTFTVTGKLSQGYTLSLTSGSLTIAGSTYTVSSGSAQMNPSATMISGQGTTTPTGQFMVHAMAHGNFVGLSGSVSLDFTNGTTEYYVILNGSVQG